MRKLILILVLLVLSVIGFMVWTVQQKGQMAEVPRVNTAALQKPETNDIEMRVRFHDELQGYLEKEDFQSLEKIAAEITSQKSRFPGGDWKLKRYFEAVSSPPHGYNEEAVDWPKRFASLEKWRSLKPGSVYAAIGLAQAYLGYASYFLEGHPVIGVVDPGIAQPYEKAEAILQSVADRRTTCVAWFRAMQVVGLNSHWQLPRMRNLLDEAIKVEPLYYEVYLMHAMYLLPRWYGSPGDWETFAQQSADRIGGKEGDILYGEVCWQISRYYDLQEYYKVNKVSYPRIRKGFIARMNEYGPSYRYMNAFCLLAGNAGDRQTTRALMAQIGDNWEPDFWKDKKYFDSYKKWANP